MVGELKRYMYEVSVLGYRRPGGLEKMFGQLLVGSLFCTLVEPFQLMEIRQQGMKVWGFCRARRLFKLGGKLVKYGMLLALG